MSIVPLVNGQSFVTSQEEFAIGDGVLGKRVLIGRFDHEQLSGRGANVSYDLRVGPQYRDHRDENPKDLDRCGKIHLLPGAAVIIQTEEEVHFPASRFGYVVPKVGMLQKGLSNTMSKVDPGYHGPLLITLFNLGRQKVAVERFEPFCSLVVHEVLGGARAYDGGAKQIKGQPKSFMMRLRGWASWIETYRATIIVAAAVFGGLEGIVRLGLYLWHYFH